MKQYEVRDMSLAPSGHMKIQWVRDNMPLLRGLEEEFKKTRPFEGVKISLSVHLEAKTGYLALVLAAGGAEIAVTGSNVLSTQDDVVAAIADDGYKVYAYHGATPEEYERHSLKAGYLSSKTMLENWLLEKVDDNGYSIAEEKEDEEK